MKIYYIYLITLCSVLLSCSNRDNKKEAAKTTSSIHFTKDFFDFGQIEQGDKVTHDFEFKNTGKNPLVILNATATCGCTIPNWPKEPISPGSIAKIRVVFNSAGKNGLQDKMITITANTQPTETKLHLVGEVTQTSKCCNEK